MKKTIKTIYYICYTIFIILYIKLYKLYIYKRMKKKLNFGWCSKIEFSYFSDLYQMKSVDRTDPIFISLKSAAISLRECQRAGSDRHIELDRQL